MPITKSSCPFHGKIIAEVGSVHDGSFGLAAKLIEVATDCGADVVKFQVHLPEHETMKNAPMPTYFNEEDRYSYFERTGFTPEQWYLLKKYADSIGIEFMASAFSAEAVDLLDKIDVKFHKIASGEVTNLPMLERISESKTPVFLSSGMSDFAELTQAFEVLKTGGPVCVMQCSSTYPALPSQYGLNVLSELREMFGDPIGYSDHSEGVSAAISAVALGATCIEKHLTLSRKMYGSDASLAMEPDAFANLVKSIRDVHEAMENPVNKNDLSELKKMKEVFEKKIVLRRSVSKGDILQMEDLVFKKASGGIVACEYQNIIGKLLIHSLESEHVLTLSDVV